MENEKSLVTVEQREVEFYGDALTAVRANDGQVYVALPTVCDAVGLNIQAQARRINRHDILAEGYTKLAILATFDQDESKRRRMGVLRADLVPLWLSGISAKSVKPEMQTKIKRFQREAAKVLWEAFQEGRLTTDATFEELLQTDSDVVQAYKMIQGMLRLARNQVMLEARLDDYSQRLERIEATLGDPGRYVTEAQATQVSQAVKAVAIELSKRTKRNEYGGVYGELYRRYEVNSYKLLPSRRFEEVTEWLNSWLQSLIGDAPF